MKPAGADPFPTDVAILRGQRRSVELELEGGRLLARVPRRMSMEQLRPVLEGLRAQLWNRLRRKYVFDDETLNERARLVVDRYLVDLELPPFRCRFSRRQNKLWGSCTTDGRKGSIRISSRLIGHPTWVLDHILLHEIAHLRYGNHGPRFQALLRRSPDHDRGQGYLEALESVDRLGPSGSVTLEWTDANEEGHGQLPLFDPRRRRDNGGREGEA